MRILHSASGLNTLITLKVQGGGDARVLVKNVQLDPITHHPLHADFYRVNMDRKITVTVPVVLKGESRGVKQDGGVLDFVHREIEVEVLPANIPDSIEVDVTELGIGDSVHVRDVATTRAWTPISDPDMMLVHVVVIKEVVEEAPAARRWPVPRARRRRRGGGGAGGRGAAEPEVIKKGKTDKEGEARRTTRRSSEADRRARQSRAPNIARPGTTSASWWSTSWPGAGEWRGSGARSSTRCGGRAAATARCCCEAADVHEPERAGGAAIAAFYKIEPADLLIVTDDAALPLGRLRARRAAAPAGTTG